MQTPNIVLNVNGIEVIYNHVILVLKGVSLQVPEGGIVALLGELAARPKVPAERSLRIEFLASPVALTGDERGRVSRVRVERNAVSRDATGRAVARGTGQFFDVEAGLVFRSIGYLGLPLPGVPYDPKGGVIPNQEGRVCSEPGGPVLPGVYAVGWIARGPLGVIGTNKSDAQAVAERMVADVATLRPAGESLRGHESVAALLTERGVSPTSYDDWSLLDRIEVDEGRSSGKIREKFASVEQMMNQLLRARQRKDD